MTGRTRQKLLGRALVAELFPAIRAAGLAGPKAERVVIDDVDPPEEATLHHFAGSTPAGRIVLAVDVKSFSRPTFEIMAGPVPARGVMLLAPEELIPPERVTAEMLPVRGHLQAKPGSSYSPFRQPLWAHVIGADRGVADCVRLAVRRLPHLVAWLRSGTPSEYVRVLTEDRPAPPEP